MVNEPEWFQQVIDRTKQTESNLTKATWNISQLNLATTPNWK